MISKTGRIINFLFSLSFLILLTNNRPAKSSVRSVRTIAPYLIHGQLSRQYVTPLYFKIAGLGGYRYRTLKVKGSKNCWEPTEKHPDWRTSIDATEQKLRTFLILWLIFQNFDRFREIVIYISNREYILIKIT
jgi:hypothetical protein